MAKAIMGEMVRFNGSTGLMIRPIQRLGEGIGGFIRPNTKDENNLVLVMEQIGYGLVIARVCLLEVGRAENLICVGRFEPEASPFTHKGIAQEVAAIFNSIT